MSLKKLGPGLLISLATNGYGQPVRQTVSEPARAQLIYQDLANFWKAFDSSAKGTDYNAYERYYITPGSCILCSRALQYRRCIYPAIPGYWRRDERTR
ncbi:MAG: hypothetical protein EOO06_16430 [Chitinophagaceae bacterium]|nr:MAG: hypothetical protein EOO06_16430 [Chitinophagaceae bacterium]